MTETKTLKDVEAMIMPALLARLQQNKALGDVRIVDDPDPVLRGACIMNPGMDITPDCRVLYLEQYPEGHQKLTPEHDLSKITEPLALKIEMVLMYGNEDTPLSSVAISWHVDPSKHGMFSARICVAPGV